MHGPRWIAALSLFTTAFACKPAGGEQTSSTSSNPPGGDDTSTGGGETGSVSTTVTPTTSATSATTSGEESTGESGSTFIVPEDDIGREAGCDLWTPGDCGEGQACKSWANDGGNSWNAAKCAEIPADPKQPGDECTVGGSGVSGIDDCDEGSLCWNVDEMGVGTCVAYCEGTALSPSCTDPDRACSITNNGFLILCLPICDPLVQNCSDGELCIFNNTDMICVLDASGTAGAYGDPCEYVNACDPGLLCANPAVVPGCTGAAGCCSSFCDLTADDPDAVCEGRDAGQTCQPLFAEGMAPPEHEDVGVCALPI